MSYQVDKNFVFDTFKKLASIDSPTGYCNNIIKEVKTMVEEMGYNTSLNRKGNCIVEVEGEDTSYCVGFAVHIDTLGAMVRSIMDDGNLKFTTIGGLQLPTVDGEYCKIYTRDNRVYTGTILSDSPAAHVYKDAKDKKRVEEEMYIRLDEVVKNKENSQALGIMAGDIVALDTKTEITESGFIKSRFIDDKGGSTCALALLDMLNKENIKPRCNLKVIFSTYEEVGHGSSNIPQDIDELIAVDMGCIGKDLTCTEYDVSICAKDSSTPYDYNITSRLIELAKELDLNYAVDIYPFYGSDVSAAFRGGNNIKGGLIGPGVHASHGMERTHYLGMENTIKLLLAYIAK